LLSSAEADLARRDPAIPGLAVVLDPDALAAALRRAAPHADLRAAQITYVRYKPEAYCRVTYQLEVAGEALELDVRACRPDDLASWRDTGEGAGVSGPLGPGRIVLEHCAVLATVFPNDLKLVALQHLTDPAERSRVLRELVPGRSDLWQGELRCLRYRPERRYVVELRAAGGARALLKSYTRKAYARGLRNALAFRSRGPLRLAELLGSSESLRLLAFEWLPGRLLMDLCTAPEINRAAVSAAGAALAELHAQDPGGLDCWTREAEAADLVTVASELGCICPRLAGRAGELARRLAARLAAAPAMRQPLHGDFSANQVLVGRRATAIIDLDWACYGDPADDLGNFIAQAERYALDHELTVDRVESIREALLEGYTLGTNRQLPERIGLYTAVEVFRRTRFPFRAREPDWPQRTESLLERAEELSRTLTGDAP
jgi:streptomycin 6-kinase